MIHPVLDEAEEDVQLLVPEKGNQIVILHAVYPLYCCHCNTQLPGFYELEQSDRTSIAGVEPCSCGAEIRCFFPGYSGEVLSAETYFDKKPVAVYKMDLGVLYKTREETWNLLRKALGFDVYELYRGKTFRMTSLLRHIETRYSIAVTGRRKYSAEELKSMPLLINRWLELLDLIKERSS